MAGSTEHYQTDSIRHAPSSSATTVPGIKSGTKSSVLQSTGNNNNAYNFSHHELLEGEAKEESIKFEEPNETALLNSRRIPRVRNFLRSTKPIDSTTFVYLHQLVRFFMHRKQEDAIHSICESKPVDAPVSLDFNFIIARLIKNHEREISKKQLRGQQSTPSSSSWKLCHQLKHYKQVSSRQRGAGSQQSDPQILCFVERPFDVSHLPANVPTEMSDMKQEVNRLSSFAVKGFPAFNQLCKTGQKPEVLASNGFFYMQDADRVKCAFCLGVLYNWKQDESVPEAHRLRFSTCPLLLSLDVGNVPIVRLEADANLQLSCMCSDHLDPAPLPLEPAQPSWAPDRGSPDEVDCLAHMSCRPQAPVSPSVAAAACRPGAADNLEMLARSLHSPETAARYHAMQHPHRQDQRSREDSLTRGQQCPVPPDLLACAGFFLDKELRTACYWCGLQVLNWQPGDDPWVEHARWSPRCCHLLLERGHSFVLASRRSHPPYLPKRPARHSLQTDSAAEPESQSESEPAASGFLSGGPGASSPLIDYRIEPRYFKAREDFPATLALLSVGCDSDDAKTAQFLQLKGTGDDFASGEVFLHSALAQFARRQRSALSSREHYEQVQREQAQATAREPKPLGDDDVDWRACKVCMDRVINVTLLDCKHLCCCSSCAKHLDTCPLCRTPIRATMLINVD